MEKRADVNMPGGRYCSALQAASLECQENTVRLLPEKGADVNMPGGRYCSTPQAASSRGHETIVCFLLDKGVDANMQGGVCSSPLEAASSEGYYAVRLLLEKKETVSIQDPMQAASLRDHSKNVALLEAQSTLNGGHK